MNGSASRTTLLRSGTMGNVNDPRPAILTRVLVSELSRAARDRLDGVDDILLYRLNMRVAFRGITSREGLLFHGPHGWAEAAPFWDYDPSESATWVDAAVEAATCPAPTPVREYVPVNMTIPVVCPQTARRFVAEAGGCTTAKVKVAQVGVPLTEDVARVEAVAEAMAAKEQENSLRVDANGAWDVEEAVTAIAALDRAARAVGGLEYVEQPCATVEDLARVRSRVAVPIAADESVRRAEDPYAVVRANAADVLVVKVAPLGGLRRTLDIADQCGLSVVVSSALESSVGLAVGVRAAAALPDPVRASGLATSHFFVHDPCTQPLRPEGGVLPVRPVSPDEGLIDEAGFDPACRHRWLQRLHAIGEVPRKAWQ